MGSSYLRFVIDQFLTHKVRFLLTISGIVVGVSSLAVLASFLTVGKGVLRETSTRATGEDLMTINNDWRARRRYPDERLLSKQDERMVEGSKTLENVSFNAQYGPDSMKWVFLGKDGESLVSGLEPEAFPANQLITVTGRRFLSSEYHDFGRVVVLGADVLKGHPRPWIGQWITIRNYKFRIIGLLASKPTMGPGKDWSWNERIILPSTTYNILYNPDRTPDSITGRVGLANELATLEESLRSAQTMVGQILMLDRNHKNFRISGAEERDSNETTILLVIQILMIATTVFSLIVGGINVMNIMLVTVTERTREIGIRRALGATRRDILMQFLLESVLITMTGALVVLVLSLGGLKILSEVLTRIYYPWPFFIAWWSIVLGIALTAGIGIIFGLSPALKASRLDPVEALRYE